MAHAREVPVAYADDYHRGFARAQEDSAKFALGHDGEAGFARMSDQYVYFIQADENGPIKIGFTADDPKRRLSQLQTGNASALKLLGAIKGTAVQERQFHTALSEWRLQGEWFEPHPTVLATVQNALSAEEQQHAVPCLHCSFCLRCQDDVSVLVAGPAGNICDECVEISAETVAEHRALKEASKSPSSEAA